MLERPPLGFAIDGEPCPMFDGRWIVRRLVETGGSIITHNVPVPPGHRLCFMKLEDTCDGGSYQHQTHDSRNIYLTAVTGNGLVTGVAFAVAQ